MIWTLADGTVVHGAAAMRLVCAERGLDWGLFRRQSQKGLARRKGGRRIVRLPDDWRACFYAMFGAGSVHEFIRYVPECRPAVVVIPAVTDTAWAHTMMNACAAISGIRGRISYLDAATGKRMGSNPKGTIVLLFADSLHDVARFADIMSVLGWVSIPANSRDA